MYESEKDLLYSQVLKEGEAQGARQEATWEELQGSGLTQTGREPRESEGLGTRAFMPLLEVKVKYTSKRQERISLVQLNASRSQSGRARRGICGRDQICHTGAPGHLGRVLTACL